MDEWNFWAVLQQLLIIFAIISQVFVAFKIVSQSSGAEQFVRSTSIAAGMLIFLASKAFNITFADLMFLAVTDASLLKVITIGTIIPIIIGVLVAHVTINAMSSDNDFAVRILLLVGVFTLFQISYLNYFALTKTSLPIDKALIPNVCYSLSAMLWVIFNFKETKQSSYSRY